LMHLSSHLAKEKMFEEGIKSIKKERLCSMDPCQ